MALRFRGAHAHNKVRATFEGLLGAEVVRRALAALHDDTDNKEEPGDNNKEDGFVVTQDDNTKDNKTLGGKALKVQQGSSREAHQKTHKEAHHPAYEGGGRPTDATKAADLIASDDYNGLSDLETALATKLAAKPIVAPPPYKGQDLDIDGCDGLDRLDRFDKLPGFLAQRA